MIAMAMPPASASLSEKFDYWLSRLRGVEHRGGGQYVACCPHHGDEKQSLSTRIGDRSIVATCFTGCKFPQICHAVGVTANWAFDPKESAPVMRDVASWLYCDELGDPVFRTVRREDGTVGKDGKKSKEFRQQSPDGKGGWKNGVKGVRVIPYRLPNIVFSEGVVLIVEGEKHCDRLDELGFVATCNAGGAATGNGKGKWKSEHSEFLRGRDVVILPDNDEPGRSHAHNVAKSLIEHGAKSVRVAILPGLPEKGDIVDFLNAGGTKDQIQQAIDESKPVEEAFPEEQQSSAVEGEDGPTPMEIAESFLKIKYDHPERSTLAYHRKSFFEYTGTHYRPVEDEDLRCYLTSHIDMVTRSMSMNRLASVMQCVKAQTHVPSSAEASSWIDDIERPGQFIALKNGILNLSGVLSGQQNVLLPHSPNWFSPVCLPYDYNPDAQCPRWFDALITSLEGNFELTCLLQEWFGYLLTKGTHQQKFAILYGEGGTGKSTTCAALSAMLGDANVSSVSLEDLGSRFQLYRTLGKLANVSAETEEITKVAEGRLKALTSGDPVPFEEKGKPIFDATPTARLIFAMNNLPRFTDRSSGLWRRLILIPFDKVIPESERVRGMDKAEWWIQQGEMPGILNWAIEGLKRLQKAGFTNSDRCRSLIESYRRESNPARAFLLKNYREHEDGVVVTRDAYQSYRNECLNSGTQPLHEANFGKEVRRTFPKAVAKRKRIEGVPTHCYVGICEGPSEEESKEENLP